MMEKYWQKYAHILDSMLIISIWLMYFSIQMVQSINFGSNQILHSLRIHLVVSIGLVILNGHLLLWYIIDFILRRAILSSPYPLLLKAFYYSPNTYQPSSFCYLKLLWVIWESPIDLLFSIFLLHVVDLFNFLSSPFSSAIFSFRVTSNSSHVVSRAHYILSIAKCSAYNNK